MENIGSFIRKVRKLLDLKIYELAGKVGVDPVYITQIEKHNKLPSPAVFARILQSLNLSDFEVENIYEVYKKTKFPKLVEMDEMFKKAAKVSQKNQDKEMRHLKIETEKNIAFQKKFGYPKPITKEHKAIAKRVYGYPHYPPTNKKG